MSKTFLTRGLIVHPEELDQLQLDLIHEAGLTQLGLHPVGGLQADKTLEAAIAAHTLPETRALHAQAKARGMEVCYEAHALSWLMPRSLFSRHPEWFRMNDKGERTPDVNLCPSCQEALDYLSERTALLARLLDTGCHRYFYWLDDVSGISACCCPECSKLSASDQQMRVVNAMVKGIRSVDPEGELCYLAYLDALEAPTRVEPETGVFLEYAPFHRDFTRPLNDPDCAKNVSETRSLRNLLSCFGAKGARVLDYWMDNSLFSNWTKPPKPLVFHAEVMKRDLDFYAELGFEDVTSFGCYLGADYRALYGIPPIVQYGRILSRKE